MSVSISVGNINIPCFCHQNKLTKISAVIRRHTLFIQMRVCYIKWKYNVIAVPTENFNKYYNK